MFLLDIVVNDDGNRQALERQKSLLLLVLMYHRTVSMSLEDDREYLYEVETVLSCVYSFVRQV